MDKYNDVNIINAERRIVKALLELDSARTSVSCSNHKRSVLKLDACLRELNRAKSQVKKALSLSEGKCTK